MTPGDFEHGHDDVDIQSIMRYDYGEHGIIGGTSTDERRSLSDPPIGEYLLIEPKPMNIIDAVIVRIMKARKTEKHNQLLEDVIK